MTVEQTAELMDRGARRAVRAMTGDWQFPGDATFDANGAHSARFKWPSVVEREARPVARGKRMAYRLTEFGQAVQKKIATPAQPSTPQPHIRDISGNV